MIARKAMKAVAAPGAIYVGGEQGTWRLRFSAGEADIAQIMDGTCVHIAPMPHLGGVIAIIAHGTSAVYLVLFKGDAGMWMADISWTLPSGWTETVRHTQLLHDPVSRRYFLIGVASFEPLNDPSQWVTRCLRTEADADPSDPNAWTVFDVARITPAGREARIFAGRLLLFQRHASALDIPFVAAVDPATLAAEYGAKCLPDLWMHPFESLVVDGRLLCNVLAQDPLSADRERGVIVTSADGVSWAVAHTYYDEAAALGRAYHQMFLRTLPDGARQLVLLSPYTDGFGSGESPQFFGALFSLPDLEPAGTFACAAAPDGYGHWEGVVDFVPGLGWIGWSLSIDQIGQLPQWQVKAYRGRTVEDLAPVADGPELAALNALSGDPAERKKIITKLAGRRFRTWATHI